MPTNVRRRLEGVVCVGAVALLTLAGCTNRSDETKPETPAQPAAQVEQPNKPNNVVPAQPVSRRVVLPLQPFQEAVILEPPDSQLRPPDVTSAGKNVAQIFEAVAGKGLSGGLWDQVAFTDAQGRPITYTAILKTDLGDIHLEFFPEAAPNHVRNFIALARAGYYDGLPFHASQRVETEEKNWGYLETGCPKGTGEAGYGSVGYWLRPEFNSELTHDVGTVGAWHDGNASTAAGRFYITLHKAPAMDGSFTIFAKIVQGLDVARTINERPVIDEFPFDRPQEPVLIRQLVIQTTP